MPSLRYFVFISSAVIIFSLFTVNPANTVTIPDENPEFIPVTHAPCCLECSYTLPYCYNYNISNMNNGIKVLEWKLDNGFINGRAVADIDANLIIKMCFQLSLTAAYVLVDEEVDLETEFDFKVKLSSSENSKTRCIDETGSIFSYLSFVLKGNLDSDPIPEVGAQLVADIKSAIEHSVYKTAYDSLKDNPSENNDIYCYQSKKDTESPCPCY